MAKSRSVRDDDEREPTGSSSFLPLRDCSKVQWLSTAYLIHIIKQLDVVFMESCQFGNEPPHSYLLVLLP